MTTEVTLPDKSGINYGNTVNCMTTPDGRMTTTISTEQNEDKPM